MVVVVTRRVPMTRGATLRSRVKGNFQARFWNSGGRGDSPTDCRKLSGKKIAREGIPGRARKFSALYALPHADVCAPGRVGLSLCAHRLRAPDVPRVDISCAHARDGPL